MENDIIYRHLAIAYAASGRIKRIDGEDWIRVSEVKQSLCDVPRTRQPKKEIVPVCKVTFDEEKLQEIVDKAVAELVTDNKILQGMPTFNREELEQALAYWYKYLAYCYEHEHLEADNEEQRDRAIWCAIDTIRYCIEHDSGYQKGDKNYSISRKRKWKIDKHGEHFCPKCGHYALYEEDQENDYYEVQSNFCPECGANLKGEEK